MTIHTSRAYTGKKDLGCMFDLLAAVRPADRITDSPSIVDLREALASAQIQGSTRLWFAENGRLVAFAYVDLYHNLRFEFDPREAHPGLELEIVCWGEACIRRVMPARGEPMTLDASCRADDAERIAFLERHGFQMDEMRSLHMVRPLAEPIPPPQLPPGFRLRHVTGEHEVGALVALHRAAFGTQAMTVEERLAMMRLPEYEPELDLLVIAPDGRLAAYCMCSISREENERSGRKEGWTDPVATHPDFQRRGLALALLLAGLQALKQRGMDTAALGTRGDNVPMQRAARAAGFRVQSTTLWFSKPVAPSHAVG